MTDAVEGLYAQIIRFLIRAHDWCQEGTLRHIIHSVTRPAELRYHDVLENIETGSRNIEQLAIAGSQMELRQMHTIVKLMADRVEKSESTIFEMKCMMINHQAINSSSLVDTNDKVSDLQFSEMVRIAAELSSFDPLESYSQAVMVRNLRRRTQQVNVPNAFWQSQTLKKFAESSEPSLMLIKGSFQERGALRDTAVRVAEELKSKNITTLWAVNAQLSDRATSIPNPLDILKSLAAQALTLGDSAHSQKSTALSCTQLRTATTAKEWLEILGATLENVCREVYIVLELDILISSVHATSSTDEVIALFCNLLKELTGRAKRSIVKVLIVTSRTWTPLSQATNVFVETMLTGPHPRAKPQAKLRRKQGDISMYKAALRTLRR
ncbi:hypothetical protein BKA58DRAFT_437169 [Alternaria rosae]|uniref:uncharacterized protein n=2 Tax=Alternaria rosae TaxID=1187941 RepID=UPI001E8E5469|nr:uncharacterized protein BKA58DRAFT_437169 [Alternaria rosae]KAH6875179.1 hypothetical protein BKA58DRAFT_437169 [Alternaria rosae]